jgi:hypothetical protein
MALPGLPPSFGLLSLGPFCVSFYRPLAMFWPITPASLAIAFDPTRIFSPQSLDVARIAESASDVFSVWVTIADASDRSGHKT